MKKVLLNILRIIGWTATLLSILVVFGFSYETAFESSRRSAGLSLFLAHLWHGDFDTLPENVQLSIMNVCVFFVRKLAHYLEYGLIGTLSSLTIQTYKLDMKIKMLIPTSLGLCVAIFDELSQIFHEGRAPQFRDVMIDFCGTITAVAGIALIFTVIKHYMNKKKSLV